jgi:hypothetical protein
MLLATPMKAESAQNYPKLPKFAKICPKTISLKNFEIPQKIEILIFFQKKTFVCRRGSKACAHFLDFL